ncbi:hypothetical protein Drorol1_Dr00012671 [Drosera rotundifolia]
MKPGLLSPPSPIPALIYGGTGGAVLLPPLVWNPNRGLRAPNNSVVLRVVAAALDGRNQNHYAVLGVLRSATSGDVKKAYRLLARKWHPDVSKDKQAGEVFKSIRLAYEVLSNDSKRTQYDCTLRLNEETERTRKSSYYSTQFENGVRFTSWDEWWQQMQQGQYWRPYSDRQQYNYSYDKTTKKGEDEKQAEDMKSFFKVLVSAFISLFLMRTVGCRLSLTFSSLTTFADAELDDGYKLGYLVSWFLGDVGGILLTMCLSFTALAFGKASSCMVSMTVLFMWVCAYVASYVPLPPGTILVLLDAFFKRQDSL